jgi:hypothetical protein
MIKKNHLVFQQAVANINFVSRERVEALTAERISRNWHESGRTISAVAFAT